MSHPLTREEIERAMTRLPPHFREIIARSGIDVEKVLREESEPVETTEDDGTTPPNWPTGIPVARRRFENWSQAIDIQGVWTATPRSVEDVVTLANWAAANGVRMRANGKTHNWSPLAMGENDDKARTLIVNTRRLNHMTFNPGPTPTLTVELGATLDQVIDNLQDPHFVGGERPGDAAPGYAFHNMPGPGALSLGGILAVGGHGTSVPWRGHPTDLNGCLSNLITSFTAVVTDPASPNPRTYVLKTFSRADHDAAAFLVHLGRAFLVEATLQLVPDYWLRLDNHFPSITQLFAPPSSGAPSSDSFASYVDRSGRIEVLYFPYTSSAWTKTWTLQHEAPANPSGPYYIPLVNDVYKWESNLIAAALQRDPRLTDEFCYGEAIIGQLVSSGPNKTLYGTAGNLLRYVKNSTLRVTAGGFAIHTSRHDVQYVVSTFMAKYQALLGAAHSHEQYPMNSAVEIRVTGTDTPRGLSVPGAEPPALSATSPVRERLDTVVWVDALSIANSSYYWNPHTNPFYTSLEAALLDLWGPRGTDAERALLRPEWSKGWAFTSNGAWTNRERLAEYVATFPRYEWAARTLSRYDAAGIFTDDFLSGFLFPHEPRPAPPAAR